MERRSISAGDLMATICRQCLRYLQRSLPDMPPTRARDEKGAVRRRGGFRSPMSRLT